MSAIIAIGHIVGAIIVNVILGLAEVNFSDWVNKRHQKSVLQEASLALGISVDDFENDEYLERIVQYGANRYSTELFRNRLSDLCEWMQIGWEWLSWILQGGVLLGVIWYAVTDDTSNSVYAWWFVGIGIFFWISRYIFAYTCKLLTGRFPGQARRARKMMAEAAEKRRAT